MIVPEPPFVAQRVKAIGATVVVDVADSSDFGLLCDIKSVIAICESKDLVQAAGEFFEFWLGVLIERSINQKDIASASSDRQLLSRHYLKASRFDC